MKEDEDRAKKDREASLLEEKVLFIFYNSRNNTSREIASNVGLPRHRVDNIISRDLITKKNAYQASRPIELRDGEEE